MAIIIEACLLVGPASYLYQYVVLCMGAAVQQEDGQSKKLQLSSGAVDCESMALGSVLKDDSQSSLGKIQ